MQEPYSVKPLKYFNPRPRKEGDTKTISSGISLEYFNPRPRKEGDEYNPITNYSMEISIHALVKRATKLQIIWVLIAIFQSTPS